MKSSKTILIGIILSLIMILSACGNNNIITTKKIPLTSENVLKVFNNQYNVEHINLETGNVTATFVTKSNTNRKDSVQLIKDIQTKINENFTVTNSNSITLDNYDYKLLGATDNKKIVVGYDPDISIKTQEYNHKYSMSSKFNLLNPTSDVKITAKDREDGDLTSKIKLKNNESLTKIGTQTLTYIVTDSDGNTVTSDLDIEITK